MKFTLNKDLVIDHNGKNVRIKAGTILENTERENDEPDILAGDDNPPSVGGEKLYFNGGELNVNGVAGYYTENKLRRMGYVDGGKLLVKNNDKDIFLLLTNDERVYQLRVD
jgi:hypothetical protein